MFTGIIEEIGKIISYSKKTNGAKLTIQCSKVLEGVNIGDSICVNGVCQTVTSFGSDYFTTMLSDETLNISNFSTINAGDFVNLERALTLNSRLGGHIVSGHVDCCGEITEIEKQSDFYNLTIKVPPQTAKYIAYKGSVTLNGISLTVAEINKNIFKIAIIPHTYNNTVLKYLKIGSIVNIETDILAKYVEKLLNLSDNNKSKISIDFLAENGYV